jgi:hypothetical protein
MFPKYHGCCFCDIVTVDENWFYDFTSVPKFKNKIMGHQKCSLTMHCQTVVQIPVSRGSSVTAKYYKDVMLRKIEKHFNKVCPLSGVKRPV